MHSTQESYLSNALDDFDGHLHSVPAPPSPSAMETKCSVTVNFPELHIITSPNLLPADIRLEEPPLYTDSTPGTAPDNCVPIPDRLKTLGFRLHRCRRRHDIELGDGAGNFELPSGFREVVRFVQHTPSNVRA
jgi:hypothetical protein